MNTKYAEEFLVFAENLNYSVAAKKLFITRPTLTKHIRELESEFGCSLVVNDQGKVLLTPEGKQFIQSSAHLLNSVRQMIDGYQNMVSNLLTVRVAQTNLPWLETVLYEARYKIQQNYPAKRINIIAVDGPCSTVNALRDGTNDIVIAGIKSYVASAEHMKCPDGIHSIFLRTEEIKLLLVQDNPLFTQSVIKAKDLDGATIMLPPDIYEGYIRDKVIERFRMNGAEIKLLTMDFDDHFEYFMYDFQDLIGVVPTTLIPRFGINERNEYRIVTLEDLSIYTSFYALYTDKFAESSNGALLIKTIKDILNG